MDLIAFDLSTHTGYAVFHDGNLIDHGVLEIEPISNYKADVKSYKDLPEEYPFNLMTAAQQVAISCYQVYLKYPNSKVVIEHIEKGKQRISQNLLAFIHYAFLEQFREIGVRYLLVSDWRNQTKCYLKYWPEYRAWNAKVGRAKRKATPTKAGAKVAKIDGKIVSRIDLKKLSIIIANEHYSLDVKNDNTADAINLGRAAIELGLWS